MCDGACEGGAEVWEMWVLEGGGGCARECGGGWVATGAGGGGKGWAGEWCLEVVPPCWGPEFCRPRLLSSFSELCDVLIRDGRGGPAGGPWGGQEPMYCPWRPAVPSAGPLGIPGGMAGGGPGVGHPWYT